MARRVNTKFVTILGASVVVLVGMIYAATKLLVKQHPEQFIADARQAAAQGQWQLAAINWGKAIRISGQDPALWNELGNAMHHVAAEDPEVERLHKDRSAYEQALEINPNYAPAVRSLVQYWRDEMKTSPSVDAFREARDRAEQFMNLAPNDPDAPEIQAFLYTATIQGWLNGLDTDADRIDDTEHKLRALMAQHPENAEMPFYVALLEAHRGQILTKGGEDTEQSPAATKQFNKAAADMTQALKGQDHNVAMHFRAAQVYTVLAEEDHSSPDNQPRYAKLADVQMNQALALVKGTDPQFAEVILAAGGQAFLNEQPEKAEKVLGRLLSESSDPMTIVKGMTLLRQTPGLRAKAEQALATAMEAGGKSVEINTRQFTFLEALVNLRIADLADIVDHAAGGSDATAQHGESEVPTDPVTQALVTQINSDVQRMADSNIDPVRVIRVRALLALTEHDNITAIQVLNQGMALPVISNDPEMNWELAEAYSFVNERQMAKDYCLKVINHNPAFIPARKLLVRMLEGEPSEAARRIIDQQVNYLKRAVPNDPEVIRMELAQLDPANDVSEIQSLYARLPEATAGDVRAKVVVALRTLRNSAEAVRLLNKGLDLAPDDVPMVLSLARVFASVGHRQDAQVAVERGLAAHPKDPTLLFVLKELQQVSPDDLRKFQSELAEQDPDALSRELQLSAQALLTGDNDGAEKHLKAAEAINPNDKDVWDHYFRLYCQTKQWDKLAPYIDKLAKANYDQAHGLLYQFEAAKAKQDTDLEMQLGVQLTTDLPEFAMSYYCLGQAYQAKRQYRQAIENYETAMQKKGIVRDAAVMLKAEIDCYYDMNRPDMALSAIKEGRRRYTDDPDFEVLQIHHEMAHGQPDLAVADLQDMIRYNPNVPDLYLDLAASHMELAVSDLAIPDNAAASAQGLAARDVLRDAVKRFPDDARMYARLSEVLRFGGDFAGAVDVLQTLDRRPKWKDDPEAQDRLGQLYTAMNQPEKAQTAYVESLRRAKGKDRSPIEARYAALLCRMGKFDQALTVLVPFDAEDYDVLRQRANVLVQAGRYTEAEDQLKALSAMNPPDLAQLQVGWAELEVAMGKSDRALEHVSTALAADPRNAQALVMRAELRMGQQPPDWQSALQDLNVARIIQPDDTAMLMTLCDVYLYRLDAEQAADVLTSALRSEPNNMAVRFRLAYVLSNFQPVRLDDAQKVLEDGLKQPAGDHNAELYGDLANVFEQQGKLDLALNTVATALNQMPGSPVLIRSYLRLLLRNRQFPQAADAAQTVLKNRPDVWWAWQTRGEAEAAIGDKASGLKDLTQALNVAEAAQDIAAASSIVSVIAHDIGPDQAIDLVRQRLGTDPQWEITLIILYHERGDDVDAVKEIQTLLAESTNLPPQQRRIRLELAGMVYSTAQPKPYADLAYQTYQQMLALDPEDVEVLNNFACVCADDFSPPRVDEGLQAIRHAIEILNSRGATDPYVQDTDGWLLILSGQTSEGMEVVRKAVSREPFAEGYYHLGEAYLRINRPQEAQEQVNLALAAVTQAQSTDKPISPILKARIEDLSNRVLDALRSRTIGSIP